MSLAVYDLAAMKILAASLMLAGSLAGATFPISQLTSNATTESWGMRSSATAQGRLLWVDANQNVIFFNGQATNLVQAPGQLGNVEDTVFALGSGRSSNEVIGVWRRSDDEGWISINGGPAVPVTAVNPINATQGMNSEGVAVADGRVFMVEQAFSGGQSVKHVFQVDPATGVSTNLTGNAPVPGVEGRITTSQGQAAWPFTTNANNPANLQFFNGANVQTIDTIEGNPWLANRRLVYARTVNGFSQIFLFDANAVAPGPAVITSSPINKLFPRTDGHHLAWLENRNGSTNFTLMLLGNIPVHTPQQVLPPAVENRRDHPCGIL